MLFYEPKSTKKVYELKLSENLSQNIYAKLYAQPTKENALRLKGLSVICLEHVLIIIVIIFILISLFVNLRALIQWILIS